MATSRRNRCGSRVAATSPPQQGNTAAPNRRRSAPGFTLIELLVAIAVAAILVTIAVPSFRSTVLDSRRAAAANDFVATLNHARALALSRRVPVTVCRSTTSNAASPVCGTGNGWESGWLTYVDGNAAGTTGTLDSGEEILRQHEALNGSTLRGQTTSSTTVTFNSRGVTAQPGRFVLCDSRGC